MRSLALLSALAEQVGLEPTTLRLVGARSVRLSYCSENSVFHTRWGLSSPYAMAELHSPIETEQTFLSRV